jgi:hypothetical protein
VHTWMHVCISLSVCVHVCVRVHVCVCVFKWQNYYVRIPTFLMGPTNTELVCLSVSSAACGLTPFPSFLLSGPASDHPSVTTATGPAVFNGKDSPKHPQLVKSSLSALPRPSALGSAADSGGAGVLLFSRPGPERAWELWDWRHGASRV